MRTVTIREAREGLSHPEQLFATDDEVIVTRRGEPVARRVAEAMRARYVLLPAANAKALGGLVRTAMHMAEGSDRV